MRQPDGTLVTHREFENALTTTYQYSGSFALAQILARAATTGDWMITLFDPWDNNRQNLPCLDATGARQMCAMTISYVGERTTLSGNATAQVNGKIGVVRTNLRICQPWVVPGACNEAAPYRSMMTFSEAIVATPVDVFAGQIIQVTVVFTFS